MRRAWMGFLLLLIGVPCLANKIYLVPLDSRPATGQFPKMIGRIAGIEVVTPPESILGRFTNPGNCALVADWLIKQDLSDAIAIIVSTDMLAYGGLIESREDNVKVATALKRLSVLRNLRQKYPALPIYAFGTIMRGVPTATPERRNWRLSLARYVELQDRYRKTGEPFLLEQIRASKTQIPTGELDKYFEARTRNLDVLKSLVRMVKDKLLTYLVIGIDDAQLYGPHRSEFAEVRKYVEEREIGGLVYIGEGVDQDANLLLSRALCKHNKWMPRISVILSDPTAADRPANFESQPLRLSIRDQILASGGLVADKSEKSDYTLYLNTKGVLQSDFSLFASAIQDQLQSGTPIAVGDLNFDSKGAGDSRLAALLWQQEHLDRLLSFAAWNTAGNTIGTSVPHANVYLLARKVFDDGLHRETAQREFLFHRLVNDYGYQKYIRPQAYLLADSDPDGVREESRGDSFYILENWVSRNTKSLIEKYFDDVMKNHTFRVQDNEYQINSIQGLKVTLPWPRAFEVKIEFSLEVSPVIPR